jgi:hypothetical protein
MRAIWNQAWKAIAIPAVLLGSAALGQTRGAWVDPPADLSRPPAQAFEPSPPVQVAPPQPRSSSAQVIAAPSAQAEPDSSRSAVQLKPTGGPERYSQQGQAASSQAAPRPQQSQSAPKLAAAPTSTSRVAVQPNPLSKRSSSQQQDAQSLAVDYLNLWSASNRQTLQTTPYFYNSSVLFHGKRMSFRALLAEKRRFVQRWPDRNYQYRPGTMKLQCRSDGSTCTVQSTFDFEAANSKLDRHARGVGTHELVVSFAGERPVIISESSRVMRRGARQ